MTTPAGTFDALAMHVVMHLDDEEFWRYATECNYTVWYAPAVRGVVREEKRAQYLEKGGDFDFGGRIRTQNARGGARLVHARLLERVQRSRARGRLDRCRPGQSPSRCQIVVVSAA